jgi:hypothetical protein
MRAGGSRPPVLVEPEPLSYPLALSMSVVLRRFVDSEKTRRRTATAVADRAKKPPHESFMYYAIKVIISALVIVAIQEISKRHSGLAALLASLPLTSVLAFVWMHFEGAPPAAIAHLSTQIFWLVLPSLVLFLLLPSLLLRGVAFWLSLGLVTAATATCYLMLLPMLRRFGVSL